MFICHSSASWKVQDQGIIPAGLASGEAQFLVQSGCLFTLLPSRGGGGEGALRGLLYKKCTNPVHESSVLMT